VITGNRGAYRWIVWNSKFLGDLIVAVPQIVVGKHVVITSFDGGPFVPSEKEKKGGWRLKSGLAYSPEILQAKDLPHEQYDEWYVFPGRKEIDPPEVFVNYSGFRLRYYTSNLTLHGLMERFWLQMERLRPESYLAEGDCLIFATQDPTLYKEIVGWNPPRSEIPGGASQPM
jgi:hypothetical protein